MIHVINLEAINLPEFREVRGKDWVNFGVRNLFPVKLVELLNTSAIHNTAVQAKLDATIGEGIRIMGDDIANPTGTDQKTYTIYGSDGTEYQVVLDYEKLKKGDFKYETPQTENFKTRPFYPYEDEHENRTFKSQF